MGRFKKIEKQKAEKEEMRQVRNQSIHQQQGFFLFFKTTNCSHLLKNTVRPTMEVRDEYNSQLINHVRS